MTKQKKLNVLSLLISIFSGVAAFVLLINYCSITTCTPNFSYFRITDGLLAPLASGFFTLSTSLLLLLFFPPTIFKKWLLHIASWYLPVSLLMVASIPAFGGGMLMPSRGIMAVQMMAVLFVITVVYSSYQRFYLKTGVKV
jgi:hypothetical protein